MTTLVIMAAGLGSRYGGIKQLEGIDAQDHLIIDYSIHDAIAAGFDKIVFIIRKEIEEEFLSRIFSRVEPLCASLGMKTAYNLDGGQSSQMVAENGFVNRPINGGRPVSDIVYICDPDFGA